MDRHPDPGTTLRYAPDRRYTALAAGGVLLAAGGVLLAPDTPGRLLAGVALVVLAAYVVCDLVFAPRLVLTSREVTVRAPLARFTIPWEQVEAIRPDTRTRFGLRSTALEVDGGALLAVLSRRALGADPEDVARLAEALRPH